MRNHFRTILSLAICVLSLLSIACPFSTSDNSNLQPVGPDLRADLLIYFNRGVSEDEINGFSKAILSRPHPEGRGYISPPGMRTFLSLRRLEGHDGIAITFFPNATDEQRRELKRSIKASPLVFRVLENTTPNSVKTLE